MKLTKFLWATNGRVSSTLLLERKCRPAARADDEAVEQKGHMTGKHFSSWIRAT